MKQKKRIRSGIIGAGFAANFHFEAVHKVYGVDVDLVGVYSRRPERREEFALKRGITAFDTAEGLMDNCEVVHICTPIATHEYFAVMALQRNIYPIVEKPLTGYWGGGLDDFNGEVADKEMVRREAMNSVERILAAEEKSLARLLYAENWVYAPAIRKEKEIIEKSGAQILWMHGEESHSGSHSPTYGYWKHSGGGVMLGKGCHPLTAALYLKRVEGITRNGRPIRPKTVSARVHSITRLPSYIDQGYIRRGYHDIDDISMMHVVFEDGTLADIHASDIVLGGIHNWLEVAANNHRAVCNINPNTAMLAYTPEARHFKDLYLVEKIETKQGWSCPAPDEDFVTGFPAEMEALYRTAAYGDPLETDSFLAADAVSLIFSAYASSQNGGKETEIKTYG
jgi:predicted dehydrogenase